MPPGAQQRRIGRHGSCQYIAAIDSHVLVGTMIDDEPPLGLSWPLKAELRGLKRTASSGAARKDVTSANQLATASSPYPLEALFGHGSFPALQFPPKLLSLGWSRFWGLPRTAECGEQLGLCINILRQHHTFNFRHHQASLPTSLSTCVVEYSCSSLNSC